MPNAASSSCAHADGELHLAAGRDKSGESITDDSTISRSMLRDAAKSASEFLVTDTDDTNKLAGRESVVAHNLHSVICIPLRKTVIQDKVKDDTKVGEPNDIQGVLYLDAHFLSGKLSSVSHDILRTIANGAATLVENAALVQAEDAAKRYRQELAIAAEIQQRLMTVTVPEVPFAKVNAVSYACKDIGGDFFDLVYTDEGLVADRGRRFRQRRFGGRGRVDPTGHVVFAAGARLCSAGDDRRGKSLSVRQGCAGRNMRRWSSRGFAITATWK